jgi:hypothetical protein
MGGKRPEGFRRSAKTAARPLGELRLGDSGELCRMSTKSSKWRIVARKQLGVGEGERRQREGEQGEQRWMSGAWLIRAGEERRGDEMVPRGEEGAGTGSAINGEPRKQSE